MRHNANAVTLGAIRPTMINYTDFNKLKLGNFISDKITIQDCIDFEFMGDIWTGQKLGFTEFLNLESDPTNISSISVDLNRLSDEVVNEIASTIGLDIKKGMSEIEIYEIFGQPQKKYRFTKDRQTFDYIIGDKEYYYMSVTIHESFGLMYVVLTNHKETINKFIFRSD
jgi:hypothetical protein